MPCQDDRSVKSSHDRSNSVGRYLPSARTKLSGSFEAGMGPILEDDTDRYTMMRMLEDEQGKLGT